MVERFGPSTSWFRELGQVAHGLGGQVQSGPPLSPEQNNRPVKTFPSLVLCLVLNLVMLYNSQENEKIFLSAVFVWTQ